MLPVYYINLDSRPERRERMETQFSQLGLQAKRIAAAPPQEGDNPKIAPHFSMAGRDALRPVELANLRSHADIWRDILACGAPAGMVFEDDAVLSPAIADFAQRAPTGFDVLHLETRLYPLRLGAPVKIFGHTVRRLMDATEGAAAYVITNRAISYLLDCPFFTALPVDLLMFHAPTIYDLRVGQVVPAPAAQADVLGYEGDYAKGSISRVPIADLLVYPRWKNRIERTASLVRFGAHLAWGVRRTPVPFIG